MNDLIDHRLWQCRVVLYWTIAQHCAEEKVRRLAR